MNDALLLQRYADSQDAEAFAELVRRYAGMVHATCLRITANAHDAEDVAQDCFLELARRAGTVRSPSAWLHTVATNRARNAVRDAATRNHYEGQAMPTTHNEPSWEQLTPHVDRALEELPEELREVIVQHFLRGLTQEQVAEALGVDQSTVSRRLDKGLSELREKLAKAGVVASVAALGALLTHSASAAAVPAALTVALGKLTIAGVGQTAAATAVAGFGALATKIVAAVAVIAAVIGGAVAYQMATRPGKEQGAMATNHSVLLENAVKEKDRVVKELNLYPMTDGYLTLLLVCARVAGWKDLDYDELAAVSGTSALFGHDPADFRPRYANLLVGIDQRIAEATGFEVEWVPFKDVDGAWQVLKESIDSGRPVLGEFYEMLLFVGYQDAAEKEQRKVYALAYGGPEDYRGWKSWADFEKWFNDWAKFRRAFARHSNPVETRPSKDVALRVMKDLVAWSAEPPKIVSNTFPKAAFGLAGLDAYAANCADMEKYPNWTACMDVNSQWTLRRCTAVYLKRVADSKAFPQEVNQHLLAASDRYGSAFAGWREVYDQLGWGAPKDAGKNTERRLAAVAAVRRAAEHERAAIAEIEKALAADRLRHLRYTLSETLCDPKYAGALRINVAELLGTSNRVAAGELFVLRGEYELKGSGITSLVLAGRGRHTGVPADLAAGKGKLELTDEPLEVAPGKDRTLDLIMFGPEGELGVRLRLELINEETLRANVRREGGKVWIDGVKGWTYADRGSSPHAALAAIMQAVGDDVTYEELVGYSALAFRLQMDKGLCLSSPHPDCGFQCMDISSQLLPWTMHNYRVNADQTDKVREARQAIVASIERGIPVYYGSVEQGLIVGYLNGGEQWLCLNPGRWTREPFVETSWQDELAVLAERKAIHADHRELVLASLRQAVQMAHTEWVGDYTLGFSAWEAWLAKLAELERADDKARADVVAGNAWLFDTLIEYRTIAAKHVRAIAPLFGPGAAGHLRQAAALYERMVRECLIPNGRDPHSIAPTWAPDESKKKDLAWTPAMRAEQTKSLSAALALERAAIAEIEKALAVEAAR